MCFARVSRFFKNMIQDNPEAFIARIENYLAEVMRETKKIHEIQGRQYPIPREDAYIDHDNIYFKFSKNLREEVKNWVQKFFFHTGTNQPSYSQNFEKEFSQSLFSQINKILQRNQNDPAFSVKYLEIIYGRCGGADVQEGWRLLKLPPEINLQKTFEACYAGFIQPNVIRELTNTHRYPSVLVQMMLAFNDDHSITQQDEKLQASRLRS